MTCVDYNAFAFLRDRVDRLEAALLLFAEHEQDLTDRICHKGLTEPSRCARCSKVVVVRAVLGLHAVTGRRL